MVDYRLSDLRHMICRHAEKEKQSTTCVTEIGEASKRDGRQLCVEPSWNDDCRDQ